MKKIQLSSSMTKLSFACMIIAGLGAMSQTVAADNLADAFKNGKVNGEVRAWYFDREGSATANTAATQSIDSNIFNTAMILGYVTDSLYGFKLATTFQSNYAPFADGSIATAGTAKSDFAADEYGSGVVLSEAYLQYTKNNTNAKIGRQFISTPLVNGSGSRMVKQSFEGATLVNTDLPQTTLIAGVVTKYQARTSSSTKVNTAGDIGDFESIALTTNKSLGLTGSNALGDGDYAYTLAAINKTLPNTTLTAQFAKIVNLVDMYYMEANYEGKASTMNYGLAANYQLANWDSNINTENGKMYGVKGNLGYGDLKAYVAYTKIGDEASVAGVDGGAGLGGGAQTAFAKAYSSKTGTYDKDSKAYSVDVNYNFVNLGLVVGTRYTDVTVNSSTIKDRAYTDVYTTYTFGGALKGLMTDISYQDWSKDVEGHDLWVKANYKF